MPRLILSILPTNQDTNPVVGGGTEMEHIAPLAAAIQAEASRHPSIVAEVCTPYPESSDWPRGSLQGLIAQQKAAAAWIATTRQPGDLTVSLNLHSDSGRERHCGYYYNSPGTVSEWLGRALADAVKPWFGGKVYSADYSSYVFARELHFTACPVLLECGAHTQAADVAAVREHVGEIAAAILATMAGFFGLETVPVLNMGELRTYGEWALARCGNGQDPCRVVAIRAHLAGIGADGSEPARYGLPSLTI